MNILLWILQIVLGIYFVATGVIHFALPPGLPEQMAWMYELDSTLHLVSGTAEILGGLGLILPAATRIMPILTSLAAAGLVAVMVAAAIWHFGRGELVNIAMNLVLASVLTFVGYRRATTNRIPPRGSSVA